MEGRIAQVVEVGFEPITCCLVALLFLETRICIWLVLKCIPFLTPHIGMILSLMYSSHLFIIQE